MKKLLLLFALLQVAVVQGCYAQKKKDSSNYNYERAEEILRNDGDVDEALERINLQLVEDPKHVDALVLRGLVSAYNENFAAGLADINNAIKYYNKNANYALSSIYIARAMVYEEVGDAEKAIADYSYAYERAKKEKASQSQIMDILSSRAEIYYKLGNYAKADESYRLMLSYNETEQLAMIGLARNMLKREEYQQAVEMLNACEKLDRNYDQIYRFRLVAYDKLGEVDKAIDDALEYYGFIDDADTDLIESVVKKHISYALAKISEKMNTEDDERLLWMVFKGQVYALGYDYVSAIEWYLKMQREYGEYPDTDYYIGNWYAEIDDYDNAIAYMTKCTEAYGGRKIWPITDLADFYRLSGQLEEAIDWFTKLIDLTPTNAYGYYKRGWCYELMGNDEEAMKNYNMGIDVDKEFPYIYLMRGEQYLKQGDKEKAYADFEEVLKLDTDAENGSCRMYALHFLGRDEEAIEWMDKVIENAPGDKGNYYDQACLYARMGREQESVAALRTAFEKGFRTFSHIELDDDLDPIRELPEFKALIEEYKSKPIRVNDIVEEEEAPTDTIDDVAEVQMTRMRSGVYEVPCTINELPLKFIFDTGASTTTISSVEAAFMLKNGYLKDGDIKGKEYYSTATGDIHEGTIIRLREIKIGDAILRNVEASVSHSQKAPLLLGQSVMERFGTITIDNTTSKLTIKQK